MCVHCCASERKDRLLFSDTKFLQSFIRTGKGPGSNYYSMLQKFLACHTKRENSSWQLLSTAARQRLVVCAKCKERSWRGPSLTRIPKHYPNRDAGHYFSVAVMPTANRTVTVYNELKWRERLLEEEEINVKTIGELRKEYLVDEEVARKYLNHQQLLLTKASQRKRDKERLLLRDSHVRTKRIIEVSCISNRSCLLSFL